MNNMIDTFNSGSFTGITVGTSVEGGSWPSIPRVSLADLHLHTVQSSVCLSHQQLGSVVIPIGWITLLVSEPWRDV